MSTDRGLLHHKAGDPQRKGRSWSRGPAHDLIYGWLVWLSQASCKLGVGLAAGTRPAPRGDIAPMCGYQTPHYQEARAKEPWREIRRIATGRQKKHNKQAEGSIRPAQGGHEYPSNYEQGLAMRLHRY